MNVTYFKFDNEEQLVECMDVLREQDENATIDIIGLINKATGEVDENGNPIFANIDGYHVNVISDDIPEEVLLHEITKPATPHRIFLGQ